MWEEKTSTKKMLTRLACGAITKQAEQASRQYSAIVSTSVPSSTSFNDVKGCGSVRKINPPPPLRVTFSHGVQQ